MVLRHLCRPRDPCGAEIKAGAVSINDALALSIAELERTTCLGKMESEGARFVPQGERIGHSWMNHFARGVMKAG